MSFIELLHDTFDAALVDHATGRVAQEARFRRDNRPWYDALTAMPVHTLQGGRYWVTSQEAYDALGIPHQARPSEARRVARALACLGWTATSVGPSNRRMRGYVRFARRDVGEGRDGLITASCAI
jgi:hypothetical protein